MTVTCDKYQKKYSSSGENRIKCEKYRSVFDAVPMNIRHLLKRISLEDMEKIEEIRLKAGAPLLLYGSNFSAFLTEDGRLSKQKSRAYLVTPEDTSKALQLMCNCSIYSIEDDLRNGFITIRGGHRIGVVGKVVTEGGKVKTIKDISGLNIRISRQILKCADRIIPYLIRSNAFVFNTLIISPPQCGKTTLLRDIVRQISNGIPVMGFEGIKVGVVDERSEIAGCYNGVPQNDVGIRTDVLDACPKAQGMMMLIRSMSPSVIVTDELGRSEDLSAIQEALNAGVNIITTVHGWDVEDVLRKPVIGELLSSKIFERLVVLSRKRGPGTVEKILDVYTGENLL